MASYTEDSLELMKIMGENLNHEKERHLRKISSDPY